MLRSVCTSTQSDLSHHRWLQGAVGHWLLTEFPLRTEQTVQTSRLIWVFAGHTCNLVWNVVLQLNYREELCSQCMTWKCKPLFLDFELSVLKDIISTEIVTSGITFDFAIVNFLFLDGDVPHTTSTGVYIPQLIHFARTSSKVNSIISKKKKKKKKKNFQLWNFSN